MSRAAPAGTRVPRKRRRSRSERSSSTVSGEVHRVSTGIPFYDHMLEQVGKHGGFNLTYRCGGRSPHRHAPHGGGCRDRVWRSGASSRSSATRWVCDGSQVGCFPLDEALIDIALDLSGSAVRGVGCSRCPSACRSASPAFDPQLAEHAVAFVCNRGRHHLARARWCRGTQRASHHRGCVQGSGALPARCGARGELLSCPPRKVCL